MGTGVVSALLHNFPYHNDSLALKVAALIVFLLNLVPFVANLVSIVLCTCSSALPDCQAQYGDVTSMVVLDSEICTIIPSLSEEFALRCVVIRQHT